MLQLKNITKIYMRRIAAALFVFAILALVLVAYLDRPLQGDPQIYNYLIENGVKDTGSQNLVTGVYLDYRVFDTMFEALLLMISVTGIIYYLSPWEKISNKDVNDEEQ